MTSPRARRRRSHNGLPMQLCQGVGMLVLLLLIFVGVTHTTRASTKRNPSLTGSKRKSDLIRPQIRHLEESDQYYPGTFVDLWPDDGNTASYHTSLLSCIPGDGSNQQCQVRRQQNGSGQDAVYRVALVRPPGRIGDIFVEFVLRVLRLPGTKQSHPLELVPTSHVIGANHNYSMVIRLATLPVLLEAMDTALSLNETGTMVLGTVLPMEDVMDLVRYTIRFQCHTSLRTQDTALTTITLDRMIGYPSSTTKKIQKFLGISPNPESKKNRVNMGELPLAVMDRVNAASAFLQSAFPTTTPNKKLLDAIDQVMEEEVRASQAAEGSCRSMSAIGDSSIAITLKKL